ncbi:hypothetical protein [Pseudonocardia sp. T1-2H]
MEKLGAMNDGFVGLGQEGCWRLEGASFLATTAAAGAARILKRV